MLRTPRWASSLSRCSISRVALRSAFEAILGSVTTGVRRCGMSSYRPSSSRLGSTITSFSSSGEALYIMEMIIELMKTLLPVPVAPAISRCGICARSVIRMRPIRSLPIVRDSFEDELTNSGDSIASRNAIVCRW